MADNEMLAAFLLDQSKNITNPSLQLAKTFWDSIKVTHLNPSKVPSNKEVLDMAIKILKIVVALEDGPEEAMKL